jgi:hypothetical protein
MGWGGPVVVGGVGAYLVPWQHRNDPPAVDGYVCVHPRLLGSGLASRDASKALACMQNDTYVRTRIWSGEARKVVVVRFTTL